MYKTKKHLEGEIDSLKGINEQLKKEILSLNKVKLTNTQTSELEKREKELRIGLNNFQTKKRQVEEKEKNLLKKESIVRMREQSTGNAEIKLNEKAIEEAIRCLSYEVLKRDDFLEMRDESIRVIPFDKFEKLVLQEIKLPETVEVSMLNMYKLIAEFDGALIKEQTKNKKILEDSAKVKKRYNVVTKFNGLLGDILDL